MKKVIFSIATVAILISTGCSRSSTEIKNPRTIVWNGISKAYRYENGQWLRTESYDYEFSVVQKRYDKNWKSVKSLKRSHPDYDGRAGEREQQMFFDLVYKNLVDEKVQIDISSSLGNGNGTTDTEFRRSELIMFVPNATEEMPYNKVRIIQHYEYEKGILTETVELIKEQNGKEIPFMKNEETASIEGGPLKKAPTTYH